MASKILKNASRTLNVLQKGSKYSSVSIRKNSLWTQDGIVKSPYKNLEIPNCTLYDYVWMNLEKWPERTLSVCAVTGRGYTYEQAFKLSNNFAANLRKKFKIRDGDTIMVMLPNVPDFPLVALGILEAGGIISTVNPIYTAHEVHRQLLMSEAKTIVTLPETVDVVKSALKLAKLDIPIIVLKTNGDAIPDGTVAFNELSEDVHVDKSCLKEVRRTQKDICFLPYSSGTTGLPKGVELTNRNIIANCEQINEPLIKCHSETTATHQDTIMAVLPFFHIYAATVIMFNGMSQGLKMVTLAKFHPETFLKSLEKYKTNIMYVAPPLVILMINHPIASPKIFQYLQSVINGAAPVASSDVERFLDKVQRKIRFGSGYGLSETSPVVGMAEKNSTDYDIIGNLVSNTEMKIVDKDLKTLGQNQLGELLVKGPQVMRGYKDNPEENNHVFTEEGWFRTGDLATVDALGRFRIADRLKELIKVKGFQVPPAELEALLREHPSVFDAAVIGVPHPTKGESPKAFVALRPGKSVEPKDLCDFVADKVAAYKRIDEVVILDNIPRSSAGKVLRKDLKAKYYEVQKQLSTDIKLVIASIETAPIIKQALELYRMKIPIIVVDVSNARPNETVSYKELVNNNIELSVLKEVKRNCEDVSLLLYSSGTTGLPKGVELTHRNVVANCVQQDPEEVRHYDLTTETNQDIVLAYLPLFHCYGLCVTMLHKLSVGLKLVTLPKFQPDTYIKVLEKHKINLVFFVPPTVLFLGSSPEVKTKHLDNLKCAVSAAAPSPNADIERFLSKVKREIRFNQVYGLTETSPMATIAPVGFRNYTSVGFALPNVTLRIVDENSTNLGPNELGELLIKGPIIMRGYRNNPDANAQVLLEEGWFRSGDQARISEDGYVTIVDRLKELIKVNAYQVAPAELESLIKHHPSVFDAAVIGIPDSKTGEKPKAFVVLKKDAKTDDVDIKEFVNKRVSPYKHIKEVTFIESIPKNPSGKILRRALLEKHLKDNKK